MIDLIKEQVFQQDVNKDDCDTVDSENIMSPPEPTPGWSELSPSMYGSMGSRGSRPPSVAGSSISQLNESIAEV